MEKPCLTGANEGAGKFTALEFAQRGFTVVLAVRNQAKAERIKAVIEARGCGEVPPPDSDLAEQILKDPYNFDFLTVSKEAHEREIERGLLNHLRDLLLELGRGFSFVGSQVPLEVGGETFYLDLLFYHVSCGRSGRMSSVVSAITGNRAVVTLSRQLCSSLLHNWPRSSDREAGWR